MTHDEMLPEYDFSGGVRGKYAERHAEGSSAVRTVPDALTDEQIDTDDIAPLDADFFARASLQEPSRPTVVLAVDADVLEWFQAQGAQSKAKMNAALRIYAEAHKRAA